MFDTRREEQLKKQINARKEHIKEIEAEISEMEEELTVLQNIEIAERKLTEIEKEISKIKSKFDSTDWEQAYSEAYEDKNWNAVRVAENHLREENYLQQQINKKEKEKLKLQAYLKALKDKKKAIYQKLLLEENLEQAEPMPQ